MCTKCSHVHITLLSTALLHHLQRLCEESVNKDGILDRFSQALLYKSDFKLFFKTLKPFVRMTEIIQFTPRSQIDLGVISCHSYQVDPMVLIKFGLIWFYGISTIVGYFMPNLVFTYILDIWFVNTFYRYTQLNDQTVLFLIIQFSMSQQS